MLSPVHNKRFWPPVRMTLYSQALKGHYATLTSGSRILSDRVKCICCSNVFAGHRRGTGYLPPSPFEIKEKLVAPATRVLPFEKKKNE